jgi:hypothetical protein
MTASCLSAPRSARGALPLSRPPRQPVWDRPLAPLAPPRPQRRRGVLGLAPLVLGLVLAAALLAPEQAEQQGRICQRHNGSAACQVW